MLSVYIYVYTRFQKGWHFKNIYIFVSLGEKKNKQKVYIALYNINSLLSNKI